MYAVHGFAGDGHTHTAYKYEQKEIEVFVTAAYAAGTGGFVTMAEESSIEYLPAKRAKAQVSLQSQEIEVGDADVYGRADVSVVSSSGGNNGNNSGTNGGGSNGSSSNGSKKSSSSGSTKKSSLAKTGDTPVAQTAALLALGGAASIAAAKALREKDEGEE